MKKKKKKKKKKFSNEKMQNFEILKREKLKLFSSLLLFTLSAIARSLA